MPWSLQEIDPTSSTAEPLSIAQSSTLDETTQLNQSYTLRNQILRQRQKVYPLRQTIK